MISTRRLDEEPGFLRLVPPFPFMGYARRVPELRKYGLEPKLDVRISFQPRAGPWVEHPAGAGMARTSLLAVPAIVMLACGGDTTGGSGMKDLSGPAIADVRGEIVVQDVATLM